VANTLKRVVIIVASCIVFQTPMTLLGGVGSGIAVLGTLLYSLSKKKCVHSQRTLLSHAQNK
jgi:solute carrier family 35 protein E1